MDTWLLKSQYYKVFLKIIPRTGREEGSGWGIRVYLWRIHVDIWQNQYNIVKLKNKIKKIIPKHQRLQKIKVHL